MKTKQIIVIRKDLGMRKGKMCSQASHSSMAFITRRMQQALERGLLYEYTTIITEVEKHWLENSFTKICVSVDSEEELLALVEKGKALGIETHLIPDNGATEFHGVPTNTCAAFGPYLSDELDKLCGHLKLL
jgi:PTH2 family peptidyl-tRNA hydrolase